MAVKVLNMNKIKENVKMKVSMRNPATTHICNRCLIIPNHYQIY